MGTGYFRAIIAAASLTSLPLNNAWAGQGIISEVRLGVFEHDTGLIGTHIESGVDVSLEALSYPILPWRLIGAPRLVVGGLINSAGQSNQAYAGIVGEFTLSRGLFAREDRVFFEGTIGGDWNDGKTDVVGTPLAADWKSHGSHFLFRPGFGFGYAFNPHWSAVLSFNHISNAGLASQNDGMNDVGLIIGRKF